MDDVGSASPRRRIGRPPKYDWGDKRAICYRLYVEEQRSVADIVKYFVEHFHAGPGELPCNKGFFRQFHIWGFPSHTKKLTADEQAHVLARIKELWEQNVNQKDIKRTLADDGWELKDYEFTKLWRKNGLRLRNDQGYKPPDAETTRKRSTTHVDEDGGGLTRALHMVADAGPHFAEDADENAPLAAPMGPEEAAVRAQRLFELQIESDQRLQARKRRRRIRGYGHLPPDAPGTAPRYASETSLDECKAYLNLSNEMYQTVRKDYAKICEDTGIIKKTQCADGIWEDSKKRLIRENLHLSAMMHPLQPDQDKKTIALDCLCCDVTKRMRTQGRSITVAEANNLLGLNPTESKAVRRTLYEIFAANNFESKFVSGEHHWQQLRQQWFDSNEKLQQTVAENDLAKTKALDLLCSDAMKRFREDKNKRGERAVVQRNAKYGPGPGPAWAVTAPRSRTAAEAKAGVNLSPTGAHIPESRVRADIQDRNYPHQANGNLISPMAHAAGNIYFDLDPALSTPAPFVTAQADPPPNIQPITAYFRLAPTSTLTGTHPKIWLGKLAFANMESVRKAATSKSGATTVSKVHGLVKNQDGTEDSWLIESQDELEVYLEEAREKVSFMVVLEGGYA